MRELGYAEEAAGVVAGMAEAPAREGLREYYHPLTGRRLGARSFGWSTLPIELLDSRAGSGAARDLPVPDGSRSGLAPSPLLSSDWL